MRRNLFDPYETTGLWGIPGSDLEPQWGVLRFDQQGGLRVDVEWIPQSQASEWLRAASSGTVTVTGGWGIGQPATIPDCLVLPGKGILAPRGAVESRVCLELRAPLAYLGMAEEDPTSVQFSEVSLTATQLSSWCSDLSGFPNSRDFTEVEKPDRWVVYIRYRHPGPILIELPDATLRIGMMFTVNPGGRSASVTESPEIHITLKEPRDWDSLVSEYVLPLRDLLTLATTAPCQIESYTLLRGIVEEQREIDPWDREVHLLHVPATAERPGRDRSIVEMLFSLKDIEERVTDVIQRWLALHRTARFPMSLYFGTRYERNGYIEARFVSVVQAFEALDRRVGHTIADTDDAQGFANRVLQSAADRLSELDIERLTAALVFPGEATLHDRIIALAGEDSAIARLLVLDPPSFARAVVKTRNHLTHGTDSRGVVKDPKQLFKLTEIVDYLLQDRLLHQLGFTIDARLALFRRNWRFKESRLSWW
jgi:hypothetical protein